jgi:hypothetical protein
VIGFVRLFESVISFYDALTAPLGAKLDNYLKRFDNAYDLFIAEGDAVMKNRIADCVRVLKKSRAGFILIALLVDHVRLLLADRLTGGCIVCGPKDLAFMEKAEALARKEAAALDDAAGPSLQARVISEFREEEEGAPGELWVGSLRGRFRVNLKTKSLKVSQLPGKLADVSEIYRDHSSGCGFWTAIRL